MVNRINTQETAFNQNNGDILNLQELAAKVSIFAKPHPEGICYNALINEEKYIIIKNERWGRYPKKK